jgi:hypothetical protein
MLKRAVATAQPAAVYAGAGSLWKMVGEIIGCSAEECSAQWHRLSLASEDVGHGSDAREDVGHGSDAREDVGHGSDARVSDASQVYTGESASQNMTQETQDGQGGSVVGSAGKEKARLPRPICDAIAAQTCQPYATWTAAEASALIAAQHRR